MTRKKYSSSLSRQSSESKPSIKLVLVTWEPLLYLKFNKLNKQNVYEVNLFKKFNFSKSQNTCWHTDWCLEWNVKTSKHYFLKSVKKNSHITLLSDAKAPVRFRAQQQAKYSSLQLTANCIAAKRCLQHYFKLIWESPTTEDINFHRH